MEKRLWYPNGEQFFTHSFTSKSAFKWNPEIRASAPQKLFISILHFNIGQSVSAEQEVLCLIRVTGSFYKEFVSSITESRLVPGW